MPKPKSQIADTLKQAAKLAGVAVEAVRYARDHGCEAFNHGRANMDLLIPWLEEHKEEIEAAASVTKEQVQIKLGLQRLERGAFDFEVAKGRYLPRAQACDLLKQIAQHQRAVLQRKLETELPPKLLGLDVLSITEIMRKTVDEVCQILHDRTTPWQTES